MGPRRSSLFAVEERSIGGVIGTVFEARRSDSPLVSVVVDRARQLPLVATYRTGHTLTRTYREAVRDEPPPAGDQAAPREGTREIYVVLTPEQAVAKLGLVRVPPSLAGLPLTALYSYESSSPLLPPVASVVAAWGDERDGRGAIYLVVTDHAPPPESLGLEDLGGEVTLRFEERGSQVLIVAPDMDTLEAALRVLRPGLSLPSASPNDGW